MFQLNYRISGFTCSACAKLAQKRIAGIAGIQKVEVKENGEVDLTAERQISKSELIEVLKETSYQVL